MIKIVILAIVQGITEFLPISSSAHLIILRNIINLNLENSVGLTFDVSLHLGTLFVVLVFFYKDFFNISKNFFKGDKTLLNIFIATIPAAIIGVLFEDVIDNFIRNNLNIIAFFLVVVGFILYVSDRLGKSDKIIKDISYIDSLKIGISQIFALIPGVSRSGVTITSLRLLGVNRVDATKFSFYLSLPIVLGTSLYTLMKYGYNIDFKILIIGVFTSFIAGLWSIKFLLNFINSHDYKIFMIYRLILGIIILILV